MFSIFNPYVLVGFVLTLLGVFFYGHHSGYQERVAEDQAEIERLNSESRAKEVELQQKLARASIQLKKAKDDVIQKQSDINKRIDTGELRLPSSCGVQADAGASVGNATAGTESDRQAIKDIVQIAADGDSAILSLNSCINQYETVMKMVNEGVK